MDKLPVYEMVIDENPESDVEVSFIALVDKPAIEKNFMAFKNMTMNFKADTKRKIISGPAMVPDTLIYRRDDNGEYNVYFSKQTIEDIAVKFFKKDYQKNINLFHDPNLAVDGVTVFESFVSDDTRGIQPMKGFEDLPQGTLFISAKVENDKVWAEIESGRVKGFSVEGYFATVKTKPQAIEEKIFQLLSATVPENNHNKKTDIMSKLKDIILKFKKDHFDLPVTPAVPAPVVAPVTQVTMADYQTKDGKTVSCDKLEMGGKMTMDGQPAIAGDYELADGTKVTVADGGVISVVTPPMEMSKPLTMTEVEAAIQKALTGYKAPADPAVAALTTQLAEQKKLNENQTTIIKELFAIVELIGEQPTEPPVVGSRQQFLKKFEEDKNERLTALSKNLANLKKSA
jgi:hypothetical protein